MASQNATIDSFLIAQQITCSYPVSDIYAPTGRYLYLVLLVLCFITPRHGWLANIFLGAAVAYAATAAIEAFILLSGQLSPYAGQNVTIPYIDSGNLSASLTGIQSLVMNTDQLLVQPDYLELDLDASTMVVIAAYLVGLPLQCWSSTARTTRILHVLIFVWNIVMLAGSICVLILWPSLGALATQYRFCYAGFLDDNDLHNPGWDSSIWLSDWNSTIRSLFEPDYLTNTVWLNYTSNCLYPCFNTSQVLRNPTALKADVFGPEAPGAKLHTATSIEQDPFQPLIYTGIVCATAAQLFLLVVGRLRFCTQRIPIYRPVQLWLKRGDITRAFWVDVKDTWTYFSAKVSKRTSRTMLPRSTSTERRHISLRRFWRVFHFVVDFATLMVLLAAMLIEPIVAVAFVIWIERYIRADGKPNESPQAIGQWGLLVQIAVVLVAAIILRFRWIVASADEVERDIESTREHLAHLEEIASKKTRERRKGKKEQKATRSDTQPLSGLRSVIANVTSIRVKGKDESKAGDAAGHRPPV